MEPIFFAHTDTPVAAHDAVEDASIALVRRAQQGDPRAFRALYETHRRRVSRTVMRLAGITADHDDLVQEVFIQVYRSVGSFRCESRFTTWLHRVTLNVVLMHRRSARSRPSLANELPEGLADAHDSPADHAARSERLRALYAILDKLTEKKRTVFILHDLEGMDPSEIAELCDTNVLTVRTRLFYARREVAERMARSPALHELVAAA